MTTYTRVYVASRRTKVDSAHRMSVAEAYPSSLAEGWTDATGQITTDPTTVPFMLAIGAVSAAEATAIAADSNYIVLGTQTVDDTDGRITGGNLDNALTLPQLNAAKTWLNNRWPAVVTALTPLVKVGDSRRDLAHALISLLKD